jgi:hypothetical protein
VCDLKTVESFPGCSAALWDDVNRFIFFLRIEDKLALSIRDPRVVCPILLGTYEDGFLMSQVHLDVTWCSMYRVETARHRVMT